MSRRLLIAALSLIAAMSVVQCGGEEAPDGLLVSVTADGLGDGQTLNRLLFFIRRAWSRIVRISFKSVSGWYLDGVRFFSPDFAAFPP